MDGSSVNPSQRDGDTSHSSFEGHDVNHVETVAVSSITFHDLSYEVTQRKYCKRLPNKTILNSVSGEMKTGMNAIMGPTGSGKTTLLDLLADRKDKSGRSGKVLVNAQRRQANFKTIVGYVVQDDVVMGTLSVRENLQFSAALRLPGDMTRDQRRERVEGVIETLGLYQCANTKVGTEFFRGVSGGERKRTNIGMELIIEPQVLFLDEPTTGLDAHTAVSVMSLLKDLSVNDNRVIVLSIHQPRYSIFKLFDSLSLLSQGEIVYHGKASLALDYFDRLGFTCEEHENPADFFLDVIIRSERESRNQSQESLTVYFTPSDEEAAAVSAVSSKVQLVESYHKSVEFQELHKTIDPVLQNMRDEEQKEGTASRKAKKIFVTELYATSFLWQLFIVTRRSAKNLLRSPTLSVLQLIISGVLAIIIGLIFWQLDTKPNGFNDSYKINTGADEFVAFSPWELSVLMSSVLANYLYYFLLGVVAMRTKEREGSSPKQHVAWYPIEPHVQIGIGIFFFVVANQSFGSLGAIQLFIAQKSLFIHENASGYYRVSAFFISKVLTDLLSLRLLPNTVFAVITYFMIGFQVEVEKFFIYLLLIQQVNLCAVSIAFFISAGVRNGELANVLIILPFIISLLFAGLLVSLESLPVWVSWFQYLSFMRYATEGFVINEMSGLRFQGPCEIETVFGAGDETCNDMIPPFVNNDTCSSECAFDGVAQLSQLGFGNTFATLWWDVFALAMYSSVWILLTYVVLRLIKKEK